MSGKQVVYNVAIYLRLSKDDGDNMESESITNQRKIIKDYMDSHDNMILYDEYVDDGYSGANFNRPNFKRMMKDIENKKINMVITKNLARLGRNYIEVGNYIEKIFPDYRVRYIGVLDDVDNFMDSVSNDFLPIKSVFNEKHCRDTSAAVKKSKRRKMKEGFYACNTPPFGYKKDPENPGKLIIDEVSSKTVKKIFELKGEGYTVNEIVQYLDKNKYETPAKYLKVKGLENTKRIELWRKKSVSRILCNKVYLGCCIRGKTQNISYKSKNRIYVKRDECVITLNTHEPIISEELFNKVHNPNRYGNSPKKRSESKYLLKGLIYCKNCSKKMIFKKERKRVHIVCNEYSENPELCSNDCRMDYYELESKVLDYLINMYEEYIKNKNNKDKLYKKYAENTVKEREEDLIKLKQELGRINFNISSLYNMRLSGAIDETEYKSRYDTLLKQRKQKEENISKNELEIEKNKDKLNTYSRKRTILKKINNLKKEDFDSVDIREFINRIEVFKNEVCIYFNFLEAKRIKF